ncbi:MAG TPA: fumarylacetoacetate hydrolase family protein [Dehalococcoidia bacterium]|nr:fumarylacetoacetate hydrolase family protein [Dehalococcoidia bacterium]
MRLVTFTQKGDTRVGALTADGGVADLTPAGLPQTMVELLSRPDSMDLAKEAIHHAAVIPAADVQIEAPVPSPPKVLAIGLNYRDHAEESGAQIPAKPVVFAKMPTCIVGPGHPVYMPRVSMALDYEAELCFVVGKTARYVKAEDAAQYIAGYTIGNDVSVRDWQFHSPTWMMGKSFDTHGPIGPAIVTPDEFDPGNAGIRFFVNNGMKQKSNTDHLIFSIGEIIEYLSAGFTLEPGDVVFTGTPAGIGGAKRPPEFLKVGDVMRVEIDDLGVLENTVTEEPA